MNFGRSRQIVVWVVMLVAAAGCTIDQPFEAGFTEDEDWTPSIQLVQNDYRRIVLNIDRPPRLSLLRNITRYEVLLQSKENLSTVKHDTIPGSWISPVYLFPEFPYPYYSGPVLDHEVQYFAHVEIHYQGGIRRESNIVDFRSPPSRGTIIKQLSLPQKLPGSEWSFGEALAFHNGSLIVLRDDQLFRVDTANGSATLLKERFLPPEDYPNKTFRSVAVVGDTLVTFYFHWLSQKTTLVRLSLESSAVDSSVSVSFPNATPLTITSLEGAVLIHFIKGENQQQFLKLDPQTGQILHEYPPFAWAGIYWTDFSPDGDKLWMSLRREYDNRFVQIEPSNGSVVRDVPNPVYQTGGIAWDGSRFWVVDREAGMRLVKVLPAGF